MMKKTVFLLLLFLLVLCPALGMAEYAETAFYADEQTGEMKNYPLDYIFYHVLEDGTASVTGIGFTETAAEELNGTLYVPCKVGDYTVSAVDFRFFGEPDSERTKGFRRVVFPQSVTDFTATDEFYPLGFLFAPEIEEIVVLGEDSGLIVQEGEALLSDGVLIGLITDQKKEEFSVPDGATEMDMALVARAYPNLTALKLPATMAKIASTWNIFPAMLQKVEVHGDNPVFYSVDGVLFNDTDLYLFPSKHPATHYQVPEGTKTISYYSFSGCDGLNEVTLPESMEELFPHAFYACRNMRKINLPAGLKKIGEGAFGYCWNLEDIRISAENTAYIVEDGLLMDADRKMLIAASSNGKTLVALPDTIRTVGAYAFTNHYTMQQVALNEGLETIGTCAFNYAALTDVQLPASLKTIQEGAFDQCEYLETVTFAEGASSLETIGEGAFMYSALREIHFPAESALKTVGEDAFYSCKKLEKVTLPDGVEEIGSYAFGYCLQLKKINLPDSIQVLGEYSFTSCHALTSLMLPGDLKEVDMFTFDSCTGLRYLVLPKEAAFPFYVPDRMKKLNPYGHGRFVVYRDSKAHKECVRRNIPYTLVEEMPFYLGELRVTSASDEVLQQFLDAGGKMTYLFKLGQMTITMESPEGEKTSQSFPCKVKNDVVQLGDAGFLQYRFVDIRHVELIANQWTMQLEGEDLP